MEITQTYQDSLASGNSAVFNPTPNATYTFTSLEVATQPKTNSSFKVALYWDQDGSGKNLILIGKQIYTIKQSYKVAIENPQSFTAGKKSRVITRRHIFGANGKRETFVRWTANVI